MGAGTVLVGCKSNQKYDLIEAELRTRDRELLELRGALEQSRVLNRAYEQQIQANPTCVSGRPALAPGVFVKDIALGRGTGGYDEDNCPGDEALMVVVVPQDEDGSPVKVPARLSVAAWQVDDQGLKSPIGTWELPPEKLRPMWKAGLFSSGYTVTLPWQTFPTTNRVRVMARLTSLDGRSFESDRDVTVRPLPPQVAAGPARGALPGLPPPVYQLPMPEGAVPKELVPPGVPPTGVPPTITTGQGRGASPLPPGVEELPPPR